MRPAQNNVPSGGRAGAVGRSRAAFDRWERLASTRGATALMFAWAVAEATVWPVIPDVLLGPLVAGNRRRFYLPLAASILGSAVGGTAIFLFAYWSPSDALDFMRSVPLVRDAQLDDAAERLRDGGVGALWLQPVSGLAFRYWGVMAGVQDLDPWLVIPTFIVARAVRMTVWAAIVRLAVDRFTGIVRDYSLPLAGAYLLVAGVLWWQTQIAS